MAAQDEAYGKANFEVININLLEEIEDVFTQVDEYFANKREL